MGGGAEKLPSPVEVEVSTSAGLARVDLDEVAGPRALLLLGHGAGGGVDAPDLLAVRKAAVAAGYAVARLTQPYRVAGRRAPAPAPRLDAAFEEVAEEIRKRPGLGDIPLIAGGRSSGARVACRSAATVGAAGVIALAFPLHPPGKPERSRAAELTSVAVPTLILQGERDPFGRPDEYAAIALPKTHELRPYAGADHSFAVPKAAEPVRTDLAADVISWLDALTRT